MLNKLSNWALYYYHFKTQKNTTDICHEITNKKINKLTQNKTNEIEDYISAHIFYSVRIGFCQIFGNKYISVNLFIPSNDCLK